MASTTPHIRLLAAGMSERPNGEIIAQGFLDIDSMLSLKVDDYQREVLINTTKGRGKSSLQRAIKEGAALPSIVLGMRGQRFIDHGGDMTLECPTFIIDGLQRISALMQFAEEHPDRRDELRIGAEVRFDTNKATERDLFEILNIRRTPVSPNIILRNMKDTSKSVLTLYGLSKSDTSSILYGRVQWQQRMGRGELFSATTLARVATSLTPSASVKQRGFSSGNLMNIVSSLETKADNLGIKSFRENISTFFNLIEECWGIKNVIYSKMAPHLKGNFMIVLAGMLAQHQNFWDDSGKHLVINAQEKRKLAQFPITDFEISRLASAGNSAMPILFNYLVDHYNKGRHKNKLVVKKGKV